MSELTFSDERVRQWHEDLQAGLSVDLLGQVMALPEILSVVDASEFVAKNLQRYPEETLKLQTEGWLQAAYQPGQQRSLLQTHLEGVQDEQDLGKRLRQFRRQQMQRIIWRDIARFAGLNETLEDLSELADICVDEAVKILFGWAVKKSGMPRDREGNAQELIVIGMGKLGARELNLSSDIDLIFLYPERGETDGAKPMDNEKFFTRLTRQVIKVIGENTPDGFVFRVDTRLRPFGDSGPLVIPISFLEEYLQGQAREWERYAMVKARVISGSAFAKDEIWNLIRPFVYRRYLDFGAIESIRKMKQLINKEMYKRGMDANIKLGSGGIREIEFIGQAFQLIRGGRDTELQIRPIQQVLDVLQKLGAFDSEEVDQLKAAYVFLRLTENRIQAWKDEQTHLLPSDPVGEARLARSMGFEDWVAFYAQLEMHRNYVQTQFDHLFAAAHLDKDEENIFVQIWEEGHSEERLNQLLEQAGFLDAEIIQRYLQDFRQAPAVRFMGENGRRRLAELMPELLEVVVAADNPDLLLQRMLRFLQSIAKRTAYLALIVENPLVLSHLSHLMSDSEWIAERIVKYPLLLDELIDPGMLYTPLNKDELRNDLHFMFWNAQDDEELAMDRLRNFVQTRMLRVAAADITGAIMVNVVSDYLSYIAEVVCEYVLDTTFEGLQKKYGSPQQINGENTGFAIIAYGKLGGLELGYSSDLDLVFLHGSESVSAMTDGDKQIANEVFYARMAQRIISQFTTRIASGMLYEIDMRLRPNGNSGLLVSSLAAFSGYQSKDAWTWEHQALIRARAVAGDPQTIASFEQIRRDILSQPREAVALQKDVREMREKMRQSLDGTDAEVFDLKQGVGGIADIEFMVQYAVLRWANQYPGLLDWTDNARLLETLAKHQVLTQQEADELLSAYWAYRAEYHHLSLQNKKARVAQDQFVALREQVKTVWQRLMVEAP